MALLSGRPAGLMCLYAWGVQRNAKERTMTTNATNTKDWATTMTWSAHRKAALKKAAYLSGYLTRLTGAEQAHRGEITAGQLHAMEKASGMLEQAMVLLGCTQPLDQIEADLTSQIAWIEQNA